MPKFEDSTFDSSKCDVMLMQNELAYDNFFFDTSRDCLINIQQGPCESCVWNAIW